MDDQRGLGEAMQRAGQDDRTKEMEARVAKLEKQVALLAAKSVRAVTVDEMRDAGFEA